MGTSKRTLEQAKSKMTVKGRSSGGCTTEHFTFRYEILLSTQEFRFNLDTGGAAESNSVVDQKPIYSIEKYSQLK